MSSEYLLTLISKKLHEAEQYLTGKTNSNNSQQNEIANARFLISSRFKVLRQLMNQREEKINEGAKAYEIIKISAEIKKEIKQTDTLIGKLETLVHGKLLKLEKKLLLRIKKKENPILQSRNELKEKKSNREIPIEKEKELLDAKRLQYEKIIQKLRMVWTKFDNIERNEGNFGEGFDRKPKQVNYHDEHNVFAK
jgi:hypothetical protein